MKGIRAAEVVADIHNVDQGEGGYNEAHEYFGDLANIERLPKNVPNVAFRSAKGDNRARPVVARPLNYW